MAQFAPLPAAGTRSGTTSREGAEHHVGDALARLRAPRHRRRRPRVDDAALGRGHRDRAIEAAVGRDARIERRLERVVHRGEEREVHHVDVARALRPAAREVERERIAALRDRDRDGNRLGRDAVVVHRVGEAVHAVGQRGDRGADLALAVGQRLRARRLHGGRAVAVDQLAEPPLAEPVGGDLRPEVAPALVAAARSWRGAAPSRPPACARPRRGGSA